MSSTFSPTRIVLLLCFTLLHFGGDQITKELARRQLNYGEQVEILDGYVVLRLIENQGAFFGMGSRWSGFVRTFVLLLLPGLSVVLLTYFLFYRRPFSWWFALGCTALIGGAAGNLIDRILYQSVTDFLNLGIGSWRTGIFNLADVSILVGVVLLMIGIRPNGST